MNSQKKIGLVLGSGGARGWSHIGVIMALQELNIPIHCVSGTSMGALVGAVFASGKIDTLQHVAMELDWKHLIYYFLEIKFPRMGLIDGSRITEFIRENVMSVDIENLPIPFAAIATDAMTGEEVVMRDGSIIDAVRGSITIPGIFTPVTRNGRILIDGGLVNPLPVNIAREMGADFVIAVQITGNLAAGRAANITEKTPQQQTRSNPLIEQFRKNKAVSKWLDTMNTKLSKFKVKKLPAATAWLTRKNEPNIFEICENSVRIVETQITAMRLINEPPDILIKPDICNIGTMEFQKVNEAIEAGYHAARTQLEHLKL